VQKIPYLYTDCIGHTKLTVSPVKQVPRSFLTKHSLVNIEAAITETYPEIHGDPRSTIWEPLVSADGRAIETEMKHPAI
jgi:hypothetical protein